MPDSPASLGRINPPALRESQMRMMLAIAAMAALLGCGAATDETDARRDVAERETVFDPLTGTLDRARGAEDALRESEQARRRQLELSEGQ